MHELDLCALGELVTVCINLFALFPLGYKSTYARSPIYMKSCMRVRMLALQTQTPY